MDIELLSQLESLCKEFSLCWSVGSSRLFDYECRLFPKEQDDSRKRPARPVVIQQADSLNDAIKAAISRARIDGLIK